MFIINGQIFIVFHSVRFETRSQKRDQHEDFTEVWSGEQQAHLLWCWFPRMLVAKRWVCANPWIAEKQCKTLFRLLNCCSIQIFDRLSLRFEFDEAATEKKPPDSSRCTCYTLLFFEIGTTLQCVTGRHKLINSAGYVGHRRSVYVLCTSLRFSACGGISAAW